MLSLLDITITTYQAIGFAVALILFGVILGVFYAILMLYLTSAKRRRAS